MSKALRENRDHLERTVTERTAELRAANRELTSALADIKTLSGLIPICAACKKIRDAQFSHGLCPECLPEFFPGQELRGEGSKNGETLP